MSCHRKDLEFESRKSGSVCRAFHLSVLPEAVVTDAGKQAEAGQISPRPALAGQVDGRAKRQPGKC